MVYFVKSRYFKHQFPNYEFMREKKIRWQHEKLFYRKTRVGPAPRSMGPRSALVINDVVWYLTMPYSVVVMVVILSNFTYSNSY